MQSTPLISRSLLPSRLILLSLRKQSHSIEEESRSKARYRTLYCSWKVFSANRSLNHLSKFCPGYQNLFWDLVTLYLFERCRQLTIKNWTTQELMRPHHRSRFIKWLEGLKQVNWFRLVCQLWVSRPALKHGQLLTPFGSLLLMMNLAYLDYLQR